MTNVGIYKITSPSGKVYIGQSWNLEQRQTQYKRRSCKSQPILYNSISFYGWDKHIFKVVQHLPEDITQEVLDNHEILYWECYKDCGYKMLNGKEPGKGGRHFNQMKPIIQLTLDGGFVKEWESAYDASIHFGLTPSGHISHVLNGRLKQCKGYTFIRKSEYDINKDYSVINFKRKIFQYDLNGNYITEFSSIIEASNKLNISDTCISQTINGVTKLCCGGFQWKDFKMDKIDKRILFKDRKKVYQYSKSGEFVKKWDSASQASEELKINRGCIVSNCNGTYEKMKTYKGFVWSYEFKPYINKVKCSYQKSIL